jgi:hypothetical protein
LDKDGRGSRRPRPGLCDCRMRRLQGLEMLEETLFIWLFRTLCRTPRLGTADSQPSIAKLPRLAKWATMPQLPYERAWACLSRLAIAQWRISTLFQERHKSAIKFRSFSDAPFHLWFILKATILLGRLLLRAQHDGRPGAGLILLNFRGIYL